MLESVPFTFTASIRSTKFPVRCFSSSGPSLRASESHDEHQVSHCSKARRTQTAREASSILPRTKASPDGFIFANGLSAGAEPGQLERGERGRPERAAGRLGRRDSALGDELDLAREPRRLLRRRARLGAGRGADRLLEHRLARREARERADHVALDRVAGGGARADLRERDRGARLLARGELADRVQPRPHPALEALPVREPGAGEPVVAARAHRERPLRREPRLGEVGEPPRGQREQRVEVLGPVLGREQRRAAARGPEPADRRAGLLEVRHVEHERRVRERARPGGGGEGEGDERGEHGFWV